MLSFITSAISSFASAVASLGSSACLVFYLDEPECPKSLMK